MKNFFEFLDDLGINKKLKSELGILILNESDLKYFENKIFSSDKSFEVMIYEMRKHKLLEQAVSLNQFELLLTENELLAVSRLLGQYISNHDWCEIKEIMKMRNISLVDIYHKHKEQVDRNSICNIWQLIL